MTRKFKLVGTLMAVVAMFAVTASAAQAQFTSEKYPATVSGSSSKDVVDFFGSAMTCTNNTFSGTLSAGSDTLTINPSFSNCLAFGLPATVNFTGCNYLFHETARTIDTVCPAGAAIDINVYASTPHGSPICHVKVPGQSTKNGYTLTQSGNNVILGGSIGSVTATQVRTSIFCPPATHIPTEGVGPAALYTIQAGGITLSGNNGKIFFD